MYSFDSRVRFSEVSEDGKLSIKGMINYLQDCSTFQSEDLQYGIEYLNSVHRAWLLSSWQIEIVRRPALGEKIKIATWPCGFRSMFGYRNFVIYGQDGEIAVKAYSIWVYVNTESGRPCRIPEEVLEQYKTEPALEMEMAGRKIEIPEELTEMETHTVMRCQIDTNGHMNNAQYYIVASEYLPGDGQIKQLRIEYKNAALRGDTIIPKVHKAENEVTVALTSADGSVYAVAYARREI